MKVSIPGMRPMFFLNMYFRQKYVACSLIFNVDNYIHSQYEISVFLFMLIWITLELTLACMRSFVPFHFFPVLC